MEKRQGSQEEVATLTEGLKVFPGGQKQYSTTYRGFVYSFHYDGPDKQALRCIRYTKGCGGRLHLNLLWNRVTLDEKSEVDHHNHSVEQAECDRRYAMWRLRYAAKRSGESTALVVASVLQDVSDSSMASFQSLKALKRTVQRTREKDSSTHHLKVKQKEDLPKLNNIFKTKSGEDIIKWDSLADTNDHNNRTIIISTDLNLQWLQYSDHWYCDGTFKVQPLFFNQLFVVSAVRGEGKNAVCFPLVFCLTSNRTTQTYTRVLEKLKDLNPKLSPISIMTDFEKAELNAFKETFPYAEQRGCFFHFRQCQHRHLQDDPILRTRQSEPDFSIHLKMLSALAFVPASDVVATLDELLDSPFFQEHQEILETFLTYFVRTWIGPFNHRGIRQAPSYPIQLWNCRESVLHGLGKTNNYSEGFNRGFAVLLSSYHPTIPKFMKGIQDQLNVTRFQIAQFISGSATTVRLEHLQRAEILKETALQYGVLSNLEFLRGVASKF